MPVTKSRVGLNEMLSLDQTNTTGFLFGDEDGAGSSETNNYLQKNATEDGFPILVRKHNPNQVICFLFIILLRRRLQKVADPFM